MDTPAAAPVPAMTPGSNDESPRVKFLCSFGGCILPRPQDGKLRYVGGETRIVSLPRDITYDELMLKVRELFEGAALLKYQQPDEDLDALVSVVNDDDVTNMMEEYDKVGSGDGFTRLRIFLFSHPEQDCSPHFDTDERETEWRYLDALNSLNDAPESRNQQQPESPVMGPVEKIHMGDQFFNPILEAGFHNQRNCETPLPQFNLHHLKIPHQGSVQHQQPHTRRYNEMEAPWSPAYYSPRHHGNHDQRPMAEFPSSPSSGRYHIPFGELSDKYLDRMSEEHGRQQVNHQLPYDHQSPFVDNVVWLPPGAINGDKAGFPGNLSHASNVYEGNSICEHCQMAFQRNQTMSEAARYPDMRWQQGGQPYMEQLNKGNEFHQLSYPCAECGPSRETYIMNPDVKLDNGIFSKEQNEHRSFYNETHNHERGWALHHQLNHWGEEPRGQISGAGRMNEHNVVEATGMNFPLGHSKLCDGHQVPSNYINHEDSRYIRPGPEFGNEGFHDQAVGAGPHIHVSALEDRGVRHGNFPSAYATDNLYQVSHAPPAAHALWRKMQSPMHCAPSYEVSSIPTQANDTNNSGILRGIQDGSPRLYIGMDNQNPWSGPSQKMGFDGNPALVEPVEDSNMQSIFLPELIASVKKAALAGAEEVKARAQGDVDGDLLHDTITKEVDHELESVIANTDLEVDSDVDHLNISNIEPTKAEEEAVARGLQTIKNDDLEEIRELGSGTYGSVYHGKWKGSDVAIKRIKASCFAGRPSERERLKFSTLNVRPYYHNRNSASALEHAITNCFLLLQVTKLPLQIKCMLLCNNRGQVPKPGLNDWLSKPKRFKSEIGEESHEQPSDIFLPALDLATTLCFLLLQVIRLPPREVQYLVVDLLSSTLPAQSASVFPVSLSFESPGSTGANLSLGVRIGRCQDHSQMREYLSGQRKGLRHRPWKGVTVFLDKISELVFLGSGVERGGLYYLETNYAPDFAQSAAAATIADFWKEALILSSLHHPNVVSFYGIVRDGPDGSLATLTEFMVNGSLKQFLQKKDRTIDRRKRLILAMDAAFGMEYLHGKNIVHFDLKCENLLVNMRDPHRPVCKIGDLGLSKVKHHTLVSGGVRGTLPWMAPELLSGKCNMVTEKIDVYSFGIVMWELLTGDEPYADMHCASIIGGIVNNTLRPQVPTWCDPEWKSLMESCWASDPGERPSFSEISQKLRKMSAAINVK
ncbi:hypothetical protein HHK36_026029 [Tetracentron sinense]|uniref:Protein kinase domain-containing protein n=1 Tax=Tetracentron sinense TaxID=13715 RepID=A0A834YJX1_TETSI|nr:hypothetical protein HHK36_026029 [Tetracentron sinense]